MSRMQVFEELGRDVERAWRERDYDERLFAELATDILAKRPLHREVSVADILEWVFTVDAFPTQLDAESKFGQPPITIVRTPRFVIDALFWLESTTDIHQHGFSGAFQVLAGGSVHARHEWELHERVNASILIGNTRFRGFELLGVGDTRPIGAGRELVHALFHLERPSVTIVIRTIHDRECGPQYLYYPPHLAVDPFVRDVHMQRKLEVLTVMKKLDLDYQRSYATQLANADFHAVFQLGKHCLAQTGDVARVCEVLEHARPRHGARVDVLRPVYEELQRTSAIMKKREVLSQAEHRFFLAMLLNLPTRAAILEAIENRFGGGDPVERVVGWIQDLADALGGGDASDDQSSLVLAEMLRGHAGANLLSRLEEDYDIEDVREHIVELERALRTAPTLRTLFRDC